MMSSSGIRTIPLKHAVLTHSPSRKDRVRAELVPVPMIGIVDMCSSTGQTLLTRMPLRLGLVIALMVGLQGTSSAQGISIPRYRGPVSPAETLSLQGMHYDPVDIPLLWTRTGEIVIAHEEHYSSGDVMGSICTGSGIFTLSLQHKTVRFLSVGDPVSLAIPALSQWPHC